MTATVNPPWQRIFLDRLHNGRSASAFCLEVVTDALRQQYGQEHCAEALEDCSREEREAIVAHLGRALYNSQGPSRIHRSSPNPNSRPCPSPSMTLNVTLTLALTLTLTLGA